MKNPYNHTFFLVMAILVFLFVAGVVYYLYNAIGLSIDREAVAMNKISSAAVSKNREQAFLDLYQSTADKWARLSGLFVPSDQIVTFIESLEAIGPAAGSQVTLSGIDADNLDTANPGTQGRVRVHVEVKGSWSAVMRTLSLSEVMPYKVIIKNVHLASGAAPVEGDSTAKTTVKTWGLMFDIEGALLVPDSTSTVANK